MRKFLGIAVVSLGACATIQPREYATLVFEQPPVMGMPGGILGIGKVTEFNGAGSVRVKPGNRRVYYRCPGTITMDEQPHLRATFERGATYVLECEGTAAVVRKRELSG
jgi:hypothetical protein|tara:strand:- start:325 stop:651 length:327 start_codon:yes stop_codon:yes gene_type:complete